MLCACDSGKRQNKLSARENLATKDKNIQIIPYADHWFYDTFSPAMPRAKYNPSKREHFFNIIKNWLKTH